MEKREIAAQREEESVRAKKSYRRMILTVEIQRIKLRLTRENKKS